jgi:hypothetical protein
LKKKKVSLYTPRERISTFTNFILKKTRNEFPATPVMNNSHGEMADDYQYYAAKPTALRIG